MKIASYTRRLMIVVALVCTPGVSYWTAESVRAADDSVKLSGCLVRGEGDGAGYLLINPPTDVSLNSPDRQVRPSGVGTSGDYTTIFYWLDEDSDLREHIGHRVEVEGNLKNNVKDGEITTERKDNWTEVTVKADGRTLKAQVPNASMFAASERDKERKSDVLVRRVDVERVRMIGATCSGN